MDGRVRLFPVPGGRIAPRLARDRAGLARLRLERMGEERQLLVPGLFCRSGPAARSLPAGFSGHARRPQHGRQRRRDVRRHPRRARGEARQPGRSWTHRDARGEGARALRALAGRARREAGVSRLRELRGARRAPARQQFPPERRQGLLPRAALGKIEARRPRRARERSRAQARQPGALPGRGSRGLLAQGPQDPVLLSGLESVREGRARLASGS